MKVYVEGRTEDPTQFAGSIGSKTAELNDELIEEAGLRQPLEALGKQLLKQFGGQKTRDSKFEVIGVNFTGIDFQFILDRTEKE